MPPPRTSRSWTPRDLDTDHDPRNLDPTGSARWPAHAPVYARSRSPLPELLRPGPKPSRTHPLRTALDGCRHRSEGAPAPPSRLNPQVRRAEPAASFNAILCAPRPTHRAPHRSPTRGRAAAHRTLCFMATLGAAREPNGPRTKRAPWLRDESGAFWFPLLLVARLPIPDGEISTKKRFSWKRGRSEGSIRTRRSPFPA